MNLGTYQVLRTVYSMDSYTKSDQSFGVPIGSEFRLDTRLVSEMMWLQLMCCTLSDFSSSQFTKGSDLEIRSRELRGELER